jgi:hypothetical protein
VFALFDLLGLRFIPRLRDAGDLLLYRLGASTGLRVDMVLRARARPQRIREHYDDLLRTAASLKRGWVPASLLIARLKNATPQSPLAAALGDYGRIVRTNFLLVYCADPASAPASPANSTRARPCTRCAATSSSDHAHRSPPTKTTTAGTPCACRSSSTPSRSGTPAT